LNKPTTRPETLDAIEVWQFCERGLLRISDGAYVFFLQLEQERVNKINIRRLTSLQTDMIDTLMKEVSNNKHLKDEFTKLFDLETNEDQVIIIVCIIKDICMFKQKPKFLLSDRPKFTVIN
jgi:DNA helicase HerA-like ATPase